MSHNDTVIKWAKQVINLRIHRQQTRGNAPGKLLLTSAGAL